MAHAVTNRVAMVARTKAAPAVADGVVVAVEVAAMSARLRGNANVLTQKEGPLL